MVCLIFSVDEAEEEDENYLVDPDRFLILSDYGLDPIKSITSAMEEAFQPVIYIHTDRACSRLVYLFKHSLDLSKHFMYLRQIFFMEAGDLLSEFYTPMFSKIGMYFKKILSMRRRKMSMIFNFKLQRKKWILIQLH